MEKIECDVAIIGAGVIGLAIARSLPASLTSFVLERHVKFGWETSSRNSEVVHSGIYYPKDSFKTRFCIKGRELLYAYCQKWGVSFKKVGKFVVATTPEEEAFLAGLKTHATSLEVPVASCTKSLIEKQEPWCQVQSGLFFPETGIVDSHELMAAFEQEFTSQGGFVAYNHFVRQITKSTVWEVEVEVGGERFLVQAPLLINAAGLGACEISAMALGATPYEHRYCRGRYFTLGQKFQHQFQHLIYPVPQKDGLGTHVTVDLQGQARLGPDTDWDTRHTRYDQIESLYECDWESLKSPFLQAVQKYAPGLGPEDLEPGLVGIRPKLFFNGKPVQEFVIENHHGFIHTLGIESPGLTSSLAIAQEVVRLSGL